MKKLFKALYESEISIQFGWFWDAGFDVRIGNEINGYIAVFNSYDINECEKWIEEKAKELYPNSFFTKTYKKGC